jgi:hypothetical protein
LENVGQAFTEGGKVGKQFTEDGKAGETPLSSSEFCHRASPALGWFSTRSLRLTTTAVHHISLKFLRAAGGTAEEIGGPLDKHGKVGKQFTTDGAVGEILSSPFSQACKGRTSHFSRILHGARMLTSKAF